MRSDLEAWDLREIIKWLTEKQPSIEEIYLFGSRAYQTGSYRSDIDIIAYSPTPLNRGSLLEPLKNKYQPVDLFETVDRKTASSLINGSVLNSPSKPIFEQLEAVKLWTRADGFAQGFNNWEQLTMAGHVFTMSILPLTRDERAAANGVRDFLAKKHLPDTLLGLDWPEVAERLAEIVRRAVLAIPNLKYKAKNICASTLVLGSEYDFQNLIHLVLKPWIPSLSRETFVINYAGQEKSADITIANNNLAIETKYISDASKKAQVLKQIEGLGTFFATHPNVRCILFLLLMDKDVPGDDSQIEAEFTKQGGQNTILVRVIRNNCKRLGLVAEAN